QRTLSRLARHDDDLGGLATLVEVLLGVESQAAARLLADVALEAGLFEDGLDVLREIDFGVRPVRQQQRQARRQQRYAVLHRGVLTRVVGKKIVGQVLLLRYEVAFRAA